MMRGLQDVWVHIETLACGVSWMDSAFRSAFPASVSSSLHDVNIALMTLIEIWTMLCRSRLIVKLQT